MHRHKEAEVACRKALNSKPDSVPAAVQLCGLLLSTQQHSAALEVLDQAEDQLQHVMLQLPQLKSVRFHTWCVARIFTIPDTLPCIDVTSLLVISLFPQ